MAFFDELKSIGRILQEAGRTERCQRILDAHVIKFGDNKKTTT